MLRGRPRGHDRSGARSCRGSEFRWSSWCFLFGRSAVEEWAKLENSLGRPVSASQLPGFAASTRRGSSCGDLRDQRLRFRRSYSFWGGRGYGCSSTRGRDGSFLRAEWGSVADRRARRLGDAPPRRHRAQGIGHSSWLPAQRPGMGVMPDP